MNPFGWFSAVELISSFNLEGGGTRFSVIVAYLIYASACSWVIYEVRAEAKLVFVVCCVSSSHPTPSFASLLILANVYTSRLEI